MGLPFLQAVIKQSANSLPLAALVGLLPAELPGHLMRSTAQDSATSPSYEYTFNAATAAFGTFSAATGADRSVFPTADSGLGAGCCQFGRPGSHAGFDGA